MTNLFETFMTMAELIDINTVQKKEYEGELVYTILPKNVDYIGFVNIYKDKFEVYLKYDGMRGQMFDFFMNITKDLKIKKELVDGNRTYQIWQMKGDIELMCLFLINLENIAIMKEIEVPAHG